MDAVVARPFIYERGDCSNNYFYIYERRVILCLNNFIKYVDKVQNKVYT